ncbi:hypothetical protein CHLRE_16g663000v5 [Chlamydomonas reinhardtii]|uniref:Globin n=1 Tax=Chlamydomonas reinhardtii TaxID=3055 RepID=A0A2K3CTN5_CHLRE|nr:uncharacterized protein CHLRE_16g663000v5 [Chlamydomonas reinhardtii]PNW71645.1 hypothetical protein CHLRE_16g663000v5 [Chlamydomonas reinhardtii]
MGNTCTGVANMVTEDEIKEAVRSIEEWQKNQANAARNGGPQSSTGPLLQRVGGSDVVKHVVELFYRHLYADPSLIKFLHDQEMTHLRAKQSAFISWLFGPPNVPYTGKSVRIAHLRIIKQRGFSPEDFDLGMKYFAESMRELGAPEILINEVLRRITPYKDAIFTPSAGDAAEEARWAAEAAAASRAASRKELLTAGSKAPSSSLQGADATATASDAAGGADAQKPAALLAGIAEVAEGATDTFVGAVAAPVAVGSRPGSRQCPFTGGRLSRPASAAVAPTATAAVAAAAQAAAGSDVSAAVSAGLHPPVPSADNAPVAVEAKPPSRAPSAAVSPPPQQQTSLSAAPPGRSATQLEQELESLGRGVDVLDAAQAVVVGEEAVVAEAAAALQRVEVAPAEEGAAAKAAAANVAAPAEPQLVLSGSGRQMAEVF